MIVANLYQKIIGFTSKFAPIYINFKLFPPKLALSYQKKLSFPQKIVTFNTNQSNVQYIKKKQLYRTIQFLN